MEHDAEYSNPNRKLCNKEWEGFEGVKSNLKFYLSCLSAQDIFEALQFNEDDTVTLTLPLYRMHDLIVEAMHFE